MFTLLKPAAALMDRLGFAKKIMLLAGFMALPVGMLIYFLVGETSEAILFAAKERVGVALVAPVQQLIHAAQEHRAALSAGQGSRMDAVLGATTRLETTDAAQGEGLESREGLRPLAAAFRALAAQATNGEAVAPPINLAMQHLVRVADATNLTLDPDMDSFYLMDASTIRLPALNEHVSRLQGMVPGMLQKGTLTPDERNRLANLVATVPEDLEAVVSDVEKALKATPALRSALGTRSQDLQVSTRAAVEVAQRWLAGDLAAARASLTQNIQRSREAGMALQEEATTQLDGLLQARILRLSGRKNGMLGACLLALLLCTYLGLGLLVSVRASIQEVVTTLEAMAAGDLRVSANVTSHDEMARLGTALNGMVERLRGTVGDMVGSVGTLASSATELSAISVQMSQGAESSSGRAQDVTSSVKDMVARLGSASAGITAASRNTTSVATATEEMTAAIADAARNSERARGIVEGAAEQASAVVTQVEALGRAASGIGQVTQTISAISAQTNLLALNATIEAARAGASGKGFGVVATEIKELARQAAAATESIRGEIDSIQATATQAIRDVQKIAQVMQDVRGVITSTAAAIEEQTTVTQDIARNIAEAARGMQHVHGDMEQTTHAAQGIASDMAVVNQAASEFSGGSANVRQSANDLARLAEQLKGLSAQFQT